MSSGNDAGAKIGEGLKGAWNTFDGAGEAIRGNINGALDGAGQALAGQSSDASPTSTRQDAAVSRDQATTSKGEAQIRDGIDKLIK